LTLKPSAFPVVHEDKNRDIEEMLSLTFFVLLSFSAFFGVDFVKVSPKYFFSLSEEV